MLFRRNTSKTPKKECLKSDTLLIYITYFLFGGITSSGSSIIVQLIHGLGLNQLTSVILVQVITDYADRLLSVVVVLSVIAMLPKKVKMI